MARDLNGLSAESTEQVIKFSPKQQSSISADEAGQAVIAKIRKAAELSHETCDRAMALAHKLAMELRGAEDRTNRLEREVALFRDRAARAEGWLQTIHQEIEEKLIAPRSASDTEQNLVSPSDPNNSETTRPPAA
jgi:RES domain-containing protein